MFLKVLLTSGPQAEGVSSGGGVSEAPSGGAARRRLESRREPLWPAVSQCAALAWNHLLALPRGKTETPFCWKK